MSFHTGIGKDKDTNSKWEKIRGKRWQQSMNARRRNWYMGMTQFYAVVNEGARIVASSEKVDFVKQDTQTNVFAILKSLP